MENCKFFFSSFNVLQSPVDDVTAEKRWNPIVEHQPRGSHNISRQTFPGIVVVVKLCFYHHKLLSFFFLFLRHLNKILNM